MTLIRNAIVVGAGLSGLVCARRLERAGIDVLVLEARDRVGGRLVTGQVGGAVVDLGGQWLSVDQPRLLALAAELGVASAPQPRDGQAVLDAGGGLFAQLAAALAQWRAMRRITRAMREVPIAAPAQARGADALDATTVADWLVGTIAHPVARARIAMHAELVFASDLAGLSLLAYLARMSATGGFGASGPELPGGGRDHRFVGGAQRLATVIAGELGDRVVTGAPVTALRDEPALAGAGLVVASASARHAARQVVLAVPPSLAVAIAGELLPPPVRALGAAMRRGGVVKCFAAYASAFWRDAGLSGEAYRPRGTVRAVVDATPPDGAAGVLLAFVVGPAAEAWHVRDPDDRRGDVLAALGELFGDAARAPIDYLEMDWAAEPWTDGCVAATPPGALTADGAAWRGSFGRLHLAGAESAIRWTGYMEGAIEAGERAAEAVIAAS